MKRNIILNFIYLTFGIIILIVPTFTLREGEQYWGFSTSLGLSFIFLSIIYFSHYFQNRQKYFSRTNQYIQHFNKQSEGITIKITDSSITYKDFESYSETKWTTYTHYKFYKDFLLLIAHDEYFGGLTISKKEVTPEQFAELSSFVTTRLRPK